MRANDIATFSRRCAALTLATASLWHLGCGRSSDQTYQPPPVESPKPLPACAAAECDALCSMDARHKLFKDQPSAMTEAEADCFACIVNAVTLCKPETLAADGAFGTATAARALDLMNLPHVGTDEPVTSPLATTPVGEPR